jgi:hypothetical protein
VYSFRCCLRLPRRSFTDQPMVAVFNHRLTPALSRCLRSRVPRSNRHGKRKKGGGLEVDAPIPQPTPSWPVLAQLATERVGVQPGVGHQTWVLTLGDLPAHIGQ